MNHLKLFSGVQFRRALWVAGLLVSVCIFGPVRADDTSLDDNAKKVGNNFGELLKGMGQEVKKVTNPDNAPAKKEKKKEMKSQENEPDKSK